MTQDNKSSSQRRLMQALIFSGALNFILTAILCYSWFKERPPIPYYVLKPIEENDPRHAQSKDLSNSDFVKELKEMSLEQLYAKLNNSQIVENGYTQRDLALGYLTTYHHFNINRALHGLPFPQQQRMLSFNDKKAEIIVYPGLSEQQYQAIIQFAHTEKWPFTSKGLFLLFQKPEFSEDISLQEAFFMTPEFLAVEMLFNRSDVSIEKKQFLQVLREGNWETLHTFSEKQKMSQDLSPEQRLRFLLEYVALNSKTAAYTILRTDPEYASKKLDDPSVINMLKLLDIKTRESEKFAKEMLISPRSDAVWKEAAVNLYKYSGEALPPAFNRATALAKFVPQANKIVAQPPMKKEVKKVVKTETVKAIVAKKENKPPIKPPAKVAANVTKKKEDPIKPKIPVKKDRLYIVQQGDSLWKISKRFNVEVDILKKHNRLSNDALKPGTPLRIP